MNQQENGNICDFCRQTIAPKHGLICDVCHVKHYCKFECREKDYPQHQNQCYLDELGQALEWYGKSLCDWEVRIAQIVFIPKRLHALMKPIFFFIKNHQWAKRTAIQLTVPKKSWALFYLTEQEEEPILLESTYSISISFIRLVYRWTTNCTFVSNGRRHAHPIPFSEILKYCEKFGTPTEFLSFIQ